MEFARKELEKYGWTEGKGLGKNENGISEPVKAKKKRSLAGVGYDAAADFTDHWWSKLYDKAASNLEVKNKNGTTKRIRRKSKDEFEITNSTWKLKRKKKNSTSEEEYSELFVKTVIIGSGGTETVRVKVSDSESDEESAKETPMTDEELFAACQGRTAHKGARHGLRALGKLARIEQQEKILLQELRYKGYSHYEKINNDDKAIPIVKNENPNSNNEINKLIKKKKQSNKSDIEYSDVEKIPVVETIELVQCNDSINKYKDGSDCGKNNKERDITKEHPSTQNNYEINTVVKKKRKKKQLNKIDIECIGNENKHITEIIETVQVYNNEVVYKNNPHQHLDQRNSSNSKKTDANNDKDTLIVGDAIIQRNCKINTEIKKKKKKKKLIKQI